MYLHTFVLFIDHGYSHLHFCSYIRGETVRIAVVILAAAAEAGNTWLWFKVLQVDLILIFSDVLMPPHHHNRKLELERQAQNYITPLLYRTIPLKRPECSLCCQCF